MESQAPPKEMTEISVEETMVFIANFFVIANSFLLTSAACIMNLV